jgi:uncharacterized protein YecE (DUF72 family)
MELERPIPEARLLNNVHGVEQSCRLRVGVAGWDYRDWNGVVYPADQPARLDRLVWISRFVDVVEINSTFYRPAVPRVADSWVHRTRERTGFVFTAKAHRAVTHDADDLTGDSLAPTLEGLRPLRESGRLGALLIQFPQSFHFNEDASERVSRLAERLADWPAVVEVRHGSWESDEAAALFSRSDIGWCLVDQPRVGHSTARPLPLVTSRVAYMRLHGRNKADWFRPDAGRDARYDYLYSGDELDTLAASARSMAAAAEELYVIQNNHFRGQALVNALQMKHLIQGQKPRAPEELVATYPDLAPQVVVERTRLF